MDDIRPVSLSSLIDESKDGEWGKAELHPDYCEMLVIRGTDFDKIKSGSIEGLPKRYIPESIAKRKKLKANDILIETAGGTENKPTGRVAFISEDFLNRYNKYAFTCASFSRFIRIDLGKANPQFIYWYLQFLYDARISYMFHTQHTGVARFQWTKFSNYNLFILPSITKQNRIASILSAYDELIEVNNQRIKLLEETASQLYKEWFVRMRFPGYKKAKFEKGIPEEWTVEEVKSFGKVITGKTPSTSIKEYYGGKIPFIKTPDMHGNMFIFQTEEFITEKGANSQKNQTLDSGALIVNCIGALSGSVSITTEASQTNQQINSLKLFNQKYLEFMFFALSDLKEVIHLYGNTGSTMTNLSKGKFERLKVLCPSENLILKYNEIVAPMFDQIKTLVQQNTHLRQIRDRLLPRLISGKLEIKEPKLKSYKNDTDLSMAAEPGAFINKT